MSNDSNIYNISKDVISIGWRQSQQLSEPLAKRRRIDVYYPDIKSNNIIEKYVSYIEKAFIYMSGQQTNGNALHKRTKGPTIDGKHIKLEPDLRSHIKYLFSMKVKHWAIIRHDSKGTGDWINLSDYLMYFLVKRIYLSTRFSDDFINQYCFDILRIITEIVLDSSESPLYESPQTSDTSIQSNNNESLTDTPIASTSTNITSHSSTNNYIQNMNSIENTINEETVNQESRESEKPHQSVETLESDESYEMQESLESHLNFRLIQLYQQLIDTFQCIDIVIKSSKSDELVNQNLLMFRLRCLINNALLTKLEEYSLKGYDLHKILIEFLENSIYPILTNACIDKQLLFYLIIDDIKPNINAVLGRMAIISSQLPQTNPNINISLGPTPIRRPNSSANDSKCTQTSDIENVTNVRSVDRSNRLEVEIQTENIQTNSCGIQTLIKDTIHCETETQTTNESQEYLIQEYTESEKEIHYLCIFCAENNYFLDKSQALKHYKQHMKLKIICENCYCRYYEWKEFIDHLNRYEKCEQNLNSKKQILNLKQFCLSIDWINSFLSFHLTDRFIELTRICKDFCPVCKTVKQMDSINSNHLVYGSQTDDSFETHLRKHLKYNTIYECIKCCDEREDKQLFKFYFDSKDVKKHLETEHNSESSSFNNSFETNLKCNEDLDTFLDKYYKKIVKINRDIEEFNENISIDS